MPVVLRRHLDIKFKVSLGKILSQNKNHESFIPCLKTYTCWFLYYWKKDQFFKLILHFYLMEDIILQKITTARYQRFTPTILATQEAEIRTTVV
jgi:hypothetical protein